MNLHNPAAAAVTAIILGSLLTAFSVVGCATSSDDTGGTDDHLETSKANATTSSSKKKACLATCTSDRKKCDASCAAVEKACRASPTGPGCDQDLLTSCRSDGESCGAGEAECEAMCENPPDPKQCLKTCDEERVACDKSCTAVEKACAAGSNAAGCDQDLLTMCRSDGENCEIGHDQCKLTCK